jgi:hypothetical protein
MRRFCFSNVHSTSFANFLEKDTKFKYQKIGKEKNPH